jgi:2-oxoglutarate ferredoxin oxidoreductase subunit gamma
MERNRLVFAGSGGQGVITAAIILGEAVVLHEGLNAVQTQSYGAAARGGVTRADLIVADSDIDFPKVTQPNVLICLSQEGYNKYYSIIRPGGLLVVDTHFVQIHSEAEARIKPLTLYETVMQEIGYPVVLNICTLGAVQALTGLVKLESLESVLEQRIPERFLEMNRKALKLGSELAASS